jgi:hypothetical protein
MTAPQYPQFPYPPAAPQGKRLNGLGIASIVIGALALVFAFVPIANLVSGFFAMIGLVLGIVGLFIKSWGKGPAIAGTIVSGIALVLSVVLAVVYTSLFATAASEVAATAEAEANRPVTVVYEVEGESQSASITYWATTTASADQDMTQASSEDLPWSHEITTKAGDDWDYSSFYVSATNDFEDEGEISCSITVDGEVVASNTASGPYATVTCSSDSFDE